MVDLFDFVVGEVAFFILAFWFCAELVAVGLKVRSSAIVLVVVVDTSFPLVEF